MIRVLLVDDHNLVRSGLKRLLEQTGDIVVTGVAGRGEEAIRLDRELEPDVILMDLSMPGVGGVEATRQICAARAGASVVMLTASRERSVVIDALDAGAVGYLMKDSDPKVLVEGVRAAAEGESPLDPRAARTLLDKRVRTPTPTLTERETEVLQLVSEGLANKQIARQLGISDKTVKAHLTKVFAQLGVADRTQAALWARDNLDANSK